MIGKITIDLVEKCRSFIDDENLQRFQFIISAVLGEYNITEKEFALVPYSERISRAYQMFFVAKKIEGLSERTLRYYKSEIDNFYKFTSKTPDLISTDDVRYYLATKQMVDGVSEVTADNTRRVLNGYFSWLSSEGYIAKNPVLPIKNIKKRRKVKHAFTDIEIEKIKDACQMAQKPIERKRNIAIVETLLSTGCRVGELSAMKINDIDFIKNSIVVLGKGNKERRVFLNDKAVLRIKEYINERNGAGDEYLFVSIDSPYKRLMISGIEIIIRTLGKKAGLKECYPHKFRRTAATTAMRRGMSVTDIQRMLGHESLETTRIYLDLDDTSLEMQHKKFM
ncbi:MAG: site-specific tyrosine recombinase/integron integrase [Acutalibacteraceae bacterium]|nr:site-specific tyrosine recombinase/integron integrase [Acutalibacteraceae bacterium]